ncbi:hypothetical protein niasHS_014475 [Heterodera schachtii]|uniref:non-specific serine/threonine protein kinase n=1 Tax=Heterodera schachtii TaxID=97005 RepID=A0ABD2IGB3_HETSC
MSDIAGASGSAFSADASSTKKKGDFLFLAELGEGSYSTVYLASERQTSRKFAVKMCLKKKIIKEKKVQQIFRERDILRLLSTPANACPFVVHLFCTFQDDESLFFVLSYAPKKDLMARLKKLQRFSVGQCQFAMAELFLALEHIHALDVIHRDVKPENILLREDGHILLSDFGCAKQIIAKRKENDDKTEGQRGEDDGKKIEKSDDGKSNKKREEEEATKLALRRRCSFVGSGAYVSPEVLNGKEVTGACDWWAFGVTLFQLLVGRLPFSADSEYLLFRQVLALSYKFPDNFSCAAARQLVQALLVLEPTQRIGAAEMGGPTTIRHHPFFDGIEWEGIEKRKSPLFDSAENG